MIWKCFFACLFLRETLPFFRDSIQIDRNVLPDSNQSYGRWRLKLHNVLLALFQQCINSRFGVVDPTTTHQQLFLSCWPNNTPNTHSSTVIYVVCTFNVYMVYTDCWNWQKKQYIEQKRYQLWNLDHQWCRHYMYVSDILFKWTLNIIQSIII